MCAVVGDGRRGRRRQWFNALTPGAAAACGRTKMERRPSGGAGSSSAWYSVRLPRGAKPRPLRALSALVASLVASALAANPACSSDFSSSPHHGASGAGGGSSGADSSTGGTGVSHTDGGVVVDAGPPFEPVTPAVYVA